MANPILAVLAAGFVIISFLVLVWVGHSQFGQRAMGLGVGVSLVAALLATGILAFLTYQVHLSTLGLLLRREQLGLLDPVFGGLGGKFTLPAAAALLTSAAAIIAALIFGSCLISLLFDQNANQPQARRVTFFYSLCLVFSLFPLVLDATLWGYRFYRDIAERGWGAESVIAAGAGLMYFSAMLVLGLWVHFLTRLFRALALGPQQPTVQPTQQPQFPQVPARQQQFQQFPQQLAQESESNWNGFSGEGATHSDNNDNDWRNFAPLTSRRRRDAR